MAADDPDSRSDTIDEFDAAVNMPPSELERWLRSEDSKRVGQKKGGNESVGHASGRRIVSIKRKHRADLTESDLAHMRKVVGYVHRHLSQRPTGDITDTPWRASLMNWGHDPTK